MQKRVMNGFQSEKFLKSYINVSESQLVKSFKEIKIKPPLVLKIMSDQALHKSDIGGVKIVKTKDEIAKNFSELIRIAKNHKIKLSGIMVQKYVEGTQLIIGIKNDSVFNHVILFGVGGIFTEVFEDISIRKCPINENDADEMINELRAAKIFHGFRRIKLDIAKLKKTLVEVSKIPLKYRNIKEMDINPFILNAEDGVAVDARIVFD